MLSKRIITVLVAAPLLAAAIQWGGGTLFVCIIMISAGASLTEFLNMTSLQSVFRKAAAVTGGLFIVWLIMYYRHYLSFESTRYQAGLFELLLTGPVVVLFCLLILLYLCYPRKLFIIKQPLITFLGVLYISLFLSYLILLYSGANGKGWVFFLLTVLWCSDIGAYVMGRMFGTRKLSPLISPYKTVEGALGGVAFSLMASVFAKKLFLENLSFNQAAVLALLIALWGQAGDLCESTLKRHFHVKDSGSILPGHGGMLDRIDSLLFAAPLTYYFKMLVA